MKKLTTYVNLALIALALIAPLAISHGFAKQERIESARRGQ